MKWANFIIWSCITFSSYAAWIITDHVVFPFLMGMGVIGMHIKDRRVTLWQRRKEEAVH